MLIVLVRMFPSKSDVVRIVLVGMFPSKLGVVRIVLVGMFPSKSDKIISMLRSSKYPLKLSLQSLSSSFIQFCTKHQEGSRERAALLRFITSFPTFLFFFYF